MAKQTINWTHPEVVELLDNYLQDSKKKSMQDLAAEVTVILGCTVTKSHIQYRITSLRKSRNILVKDHASIQPGSGAVIGEVECQPLPQTLSENYENLKSKISEALKEFKDRTGIDCNQPNLPPSLDHFDTPSLPPSFDPFDIPKPPPSFKAFDNSFEPVSVSKNPCFSSSKKRPHNFEESIPKKHCFDFDSTNKFNESREFVEVQVKLGLNKFLKDSATVEHNGLVYPFSFQRKVKETKYYVCLHDRNLDK